MTKLDNDTLLDQHLSGTRDAGSLAASEGLIDEIFRATAIVIGVPMCNFEMPAQFKAYVDQIVRVINEEQKDERFQQAMADAELAIKGFLNRLSSESNAF